MKKYRVVTNFLSKSYDDCGVLVSEWFETAQEALEAVENSRNLRCIDDPNVPVRITVCKQLRSGREIPIIA